MRRFGLFVAMAGALLACTATPLLAPAAGAAGPTSPPTVGATQWTDMHAATASTTASNQLNDVACTSASFCAAVGGQNIGSGGGTLTEVWNGTSWTVVPSPNAPTSTDDTLLSVSCVGSSFCLAVGGFGAGPVAESWNGTAWSLVTSAQPAGSNGAATLTSVSCVATNLCEILGTTNVSGAATVFGNQWNGTSLSLTPAATPTPTGGTPIPEATGMSCVSATFCLAVGDTDVQTTTAAPFSEVWNGTAWSLVTTPAPTTGTGSLLHAVSCAGTGFCEAVGQINAAGPLNQNLIETWNGSTWAITPSPNTSASQSQQLSGVSCFSATTCSAVGQANAASGVSPATLALNWNGNTWAIVPNTPNAGTVQTQANAVSCVTNWSCVAAGSSESSASPVTFVPFAMSAPIARPGYRFVASDGGIFDYGAPFLGSMGGTHLNKPIVGMAVMPGGDGYDLVASDGGIFNFGSAQFYGSTGSLRLNAPIVGMAMTADGAGYWLVASDGGIFSYGDAQFYGSTGSIHLNKPIVGMAATPDGRGYWLVASDGGIFNYGDATFQGSAGSLPLNKPVVGMTAPVTGGYYLVATDGGIFSYPTTGGPQFFGSTGSITLNKPIVGMAAVANGYYLSGSDGGIFSFPTTNGPPFLGSTGSIVLNAPIVGMTA
jgi:hypothetical protein